VEARSKKYATKKSEVLMASRSPAASFRPAAASFYRAMAESHASQRRRRAFLRQVLFHVGDEDSRSVLLNEAKPRVLAGEKSPKTVDLDRGAPFQRAANDAGYVLRGSQMPAHCAPSWAEVLRALRRAIAVELKFFLATRLEGP
jgi:hypothetical protein